MESRLGRPLTKAENKAFWATLWVVAIPAAVQGIISLGVNMLDNIMVGTLGDVALASVSLGNQLSVVMNFFLNGIGGGAAVLISQYRGKNEPEKVRNCFAVLMQFALSLAVLLTAFVFFFPTTAMRIFTDDAQAISVGAEYIRIVSLSFVLFAISNTLVVLFRWSEITKIGLTVSFLSLIVNLVCNYVLIFGKLGFEPMGVKGAAIATVIARFVELVVVLVYTFGMEKKLKLRFKDFLKFDAQIWKDYFKFGLPVTFGDIQWGFVGMFKSVLIGHMGVTMTAANAIADVILSLAQIFTAGLANGAAVIIGKSVGAGDFAHTRRLSARIQLLFACVGVTVATTVILTRSIPPTFYDCSAEVKALAETFLLIGGCTHIGTCYHAACFTGINRGAGDGKFVMKIDMICGWLIVLPCVYLTGFVLSLPLPIVYLASRIDQCFKWLIAFFRLRGNKWIHRIGEK